MRLRPCLLLAPALLLAASAGAREFWLAPARFVVVPGAVVPLRCLTGNGLNSVQRWTGTSSRLALFAHYAPGAAPVSLLPTAPDTTRVTLTFRQPGTHLVALATTETYSTLPAQEFTEYLREKGLDYVLSRRQERGEADKPGREAYRRCATTLVQVGLAAATDTTRLWSRPVGLPLEIVPEQNPYQLRPGASLTLRVLSDGVPAKGQLVQVWQQNTGETARPFQLRSNQNGRVLFRLTHPGTYLVGTVRMAPAAATQPADWQSTWSTLSFAFQPPP